MSVSWAEVQQEETLCFERVRLKHKGCYCLLPLLNDCCKLTCMQSTHQAVLRSSLKLAQRVVEKGQ